MARFSILYLLVMIVSFAVALTAAYPLAYGLIHELLMAPPWITGPDRAWYVLNSVFGRTPNAVVTVPLAMLVIATLTTTLFCVVALCREAGEHKFESS